MGHPYDTYEKVPDSGSSSSSSSSDLEDNLGSDAGLLTHELRTTRSRRRRLAVFSHVLALLAGIALAVAVLEWRQQRAQGRCTDEKLRRSSLVPAALTEYSETVRFNGTLEFPSKYRGTWEEVDDAWIDVVNIGFLDLDVTDDDIKEIGVDPETLARFPEEDGGGYVMTIEYTHQLHCLDLLRRVNPWNYPEYQKSAEEKRKRGEHKHTEAMFRTHVDHCTEMLRQVLMCHADTTPIFEQWVSVRGHPWPNFNTVHQCRNFEQIHRWSQAHVKPIEVDWPVRPEGAKALAVPP